MSILIKYPESLKTQPYFKLNFYMILIDYGNK